MDLALAATTVSLISNAIGSAKSARELAKDTDDLKLKEQISDVYDNLLDLKARVLLLDDENRQLKTELARRAAYVGPVPPSGYFYAVGDQKDQKHPICPRCMQQEPPIVAYMGAPDPDWDSRRVCNICDLDVFGR